MVACGVMVILFLWMAGRLLVVDKPAKADIILILAGDQNEVRFRRGVELLRAGYAAEIQMDANNTMTFWGKTNSQWGEEFVIAAPSDLRGHLSICGLPANSTREELLDTQDCLRRKNAHRVLIVTSDFHTRRSFDIARRVAPQFEWSVAAARTEVSQGHWWRSRMAAKNVLDEWQKLLWWKLIESHVGRR